MNQSWQPSPRVSLGLLVLLTLLAAGLRLPQLGVQSFWFDEAATWSQVNGSFLAMLSDTVSDNYPPLYNTVTWLFVQALGEAEWVLRLPAALFGIALVPMVFVLGTRVAGRSAGLLAALLVALSAFHLWYSLEARMYSLLALAACAFAWAVLRDREIQTRSSGWSVVGIGLTLLLSHPYGPLDWIAVSAAALVLSPHRARLIRFYVITWAFFLPFGIALLVHAYEITNRGFWIPEPTPQFVLDQFLDLTSALLPGLLVCAAAAFVPRRSDSPDPALLLLLALAIVPTLLGYLASLLTRPVLVDRYLIGSLPAILVLATAGTTRWLRGRWSLAAIAIAATIASALGLAYAAPPPRPDWRAAAAYITQQSLPDACTIVRPGYNTRTWRFYAGDACLARNLDQALSSPVRHIYYAAETNALDPSELAALEARLSLVRITPFETITVYEFAVPDD